jgi:hypothetical protein
MTVSPTVVERLGDQCHVLFTVDAPSYTTDSSHQALDPDVQETQILADDERAVFTAVLDGRAAVAVGQPMEIAFDFERVYLFDARSGELFSGAADQAVAAPQLAGPQPAS